MLQETNQPPAHTAEPKSGSFRAATGEDADLFNMEHYPVRATCRHCDRPITSPTFLRAFQHEE